MQRQFDRLLELATPFVAAFFVIMTVFTSTAMAKPLTLVSLSADTEQLQLNSQLGYQLAAPQVSWDLLAAQRQQENWYATDELQQLLQQPDERELWARVQLFQRNSPQQDYVLHINDLFVSDVSLYLLDANNRLVLQHNYQLQTPLTARHIASEQPVLHLQIPNREIHTLYLRLGSHGQQVPQITLFKHDAFWLQQQTYDIAQGIVLGVLLMLSLAAGLWAWRSQDSVLASFATASLLFALSISLHTGVFTRYLLPHYPAQALLWLAPVQLALLTALAWLWAAWIKQRRGRALDQQVARGMTLALLLISAISIWLPPSLSTTLLWWSTVTLGVASVVSQWLGARQHWNYTRIILLSGWALTWCSLMLLNHPAYSAWWSGWPGVKIYAAAAGGLMLIVSVLELQRGQRLWRRWRGLRQRARQLRQQLQRLFKESGEGWFRADTQGQWQSVNPPLLSILKARSRRELMQFMPAMTSLLGEHEGRFDLILSQLKQGQQWQHIVAIKRRDGSQIWLDLRLFMLPDERGIGGRCTDVTKRIEAEIHLDFLTQHDRITGLLNQRALLRSAEKPLQQRQKLSLLVIELNELERIQQQTSTDVTDQLLLQLALSLRQLVNAQTRLGRLDHQQLGAVIFDDEQAAYALAFRLQQQIREFRYNWQGRTFSVSCQIGICQAQPDTFGVETLLRQAQHAVRLARQQGEFSIHSFSVDDQRRLLSRSDEDWRTQLNSAMTYDRWQLYQQPIVALRDDDLHYYEVLLRLPRSDGTLASPAQFLPTAERTGMTSRIDKWLLQRVLQTLGEHPAERARLARCHVNIHPSTLQDPDFVMWLEQLLITHQVRPAQLALEVAETDLSHYFDICHKTFQTLNKLGVVTVLDGYGSGFNSFNLLRQLPIQQVKVNRFWVQDMLIDKLDAELVATAVRLAQLQGLETCVVGVEVDEVRRKIAALQVDYMQGFITGAPSRWQLVTP